VNPPVAAAIEQLGRAFAGHAVSALEDGQGGAFVIVDDLELGPAFTPSRSWIGFQIPALYPRADVYPHYVCPELSRSDGGPLTAPLNPGIPTPGFNRPAVMVSRRSNRWDPAMDTAALKLQRLCTWFAEQAGGSQVAA
jgi:hypothetical protein